MQWTEAPWYSQLLPAPDRQQEEDGKAESPWERRALSPCFLLPISVVSLTHTVPSISSLKLGGKGGRTSF